MSPFGWVLLVIVGAGLALVLREVWLRARRDEAPPAFFALILTGAAVWAMVAAGVVSEALPATAVVAVSIAILAFAAWGHRLIPALGSRVGAADLLRAYSEIAVVVRRPDVTEAELGDLRRKAERLGRFRNRRTERFIDAAQALLGDWADGRLTDAGEREARRQHLLELGDELFLGDHVTLTDAD